MLCPDKHGSYSGNVAFKNRIVSFKRLGFADNIKGSLVRKKASLLEKAIGIAGAIHHGVYLVAYRNLVMKIGLMTEEDW